MSAIDTSILRDPDFRLPRGPVVGLALALAWVVFLYRETAWAMATIWYRSETFNHGFVVLPVSLWLIWRRRTELPGLPVGPGYWALPLLGIAALGWLLGHLAGVNAATQLAFVTLLVLCVPAILGTRFAKAIAFPLGFLFFMVPIGEFAMPTLMDLTAKFTVAALRLTGIPVYQEGLHFVIPSGRWSVVEACSGVRYLIASTCVGFLFAYLNYVSLKRRIAFVAVSILVPIVANWARAYMIVMIGHLSDGKLAAGVDHLIYGWVFFGVIMLIMFWVGGRWAEAPVPLAPAEAPAAPGQAARHRNALAATGLTLAIVAGPALALFAIEGAGSRGPAKIAPIGDIPGWTRVDPDLDWRPAFDKPDDLAVSTFERDRTRVSIVIVYYRNQDYQRKLISSNHAVVRSGDERWARVASGAAYAELGGSPLALRSTELRAPNDRRRLVWHWYWIGGQRTASDAAGKLYGALNRLLGRGDDAAAIFLSVDKDDSAGEGALPNFARQAIPAIESALTQTQQ